MVVVFGALVVACSSPTPSETPLSTPGGLGELATFDAGSELAFEYPGRWGAAQFNNVSSFSNAIVYLSTEPLFDPCVRQLNSVTCGSPLRGDLGTDGVFLDWTHWGFPGREFDSAGGALIEIAGRRATVKNGPASDGCADIVGDAERLVTIEEPDVQSNWLEMTACLRGPDLDLIGAELDAMLASVRWLTPSQDPRPLPTGLR